MAVKAADLRAEIKNLRDAQAAVINEYAGKDMPDTIVEQVRQQDTVLATKIAEYSARAQDEQLAESNRAAMADIFGNGDTKSAATGDGGERKGEFKTLGEMFVLSLIHI